MEGGIQQGNGSNQQTKNSFNFNNDQIKLLVEKVDGQAQNDTGYTKE